MAIVLQDIAFSYGEKSVFRSLSLSFPDQGVICLTGPSGCGKTTLFRLLMGLEHPQRGRIVGMKDKTVAAVFQENRLLPWLTVAENVAVGNKEDGAVQTALQDVSLQEEQRAFPAELSGGMQRRVAIARALAAQADVLFLDEPFTGLDRPLWRDLSQVIQQRQAGKLIFLITHHPEEAEAFAPQTLAFPWESR